jgi:hypothetical protein
MTNNPFIKKIFWLTLFGITMGYFEAAVVVYLRAIYYPEGFALPLKPLTDYKIAVEVGREAASIFMLISAACLAGKKFWERFAYFMLSFGIWDILYYIWLKVLLDWPSSVWEWDVLFLIPLPWIGPVIAPVSIAVLMIVCSIMLISVIQKGGDFRPARLGYILGICGTLFVLYSFMYDLNATLHQAMPKPYRYEMLIAGYICFAAAFSISYVKCKGKERLTPASG